MAKDYESEIIKRPNFEETLSKVEQALTRKGVYVSLTRNRMEKVMACLDYSLRLEVELGIKNRMLQIAGNILQDANLVQGNGEDRKVTKHDFETWLKGLEVQALKDLGLLPGGEDTDGDQN